MPPEDDAISSLTRDHTGHLLLRAARLLDAEALRRVREQPGLAGVRPAHSRLFPHLGLEGVRPSELADRVGVTRQAISPLLADLVDWGLVELIADPADGRARLARLTDAGMRGLRSGLATLDDIEREIAGHVGDDAANAFRATLAAWVWHLEALESGDANGLAEDRGSEATC